MVFNMMMLLFHSLYLRSKGIVIFCDQERMTMNLAGSEDP